MNCTHQDTYRMADENGQAYEKCRDCELRRKEGTATWR